MRAALIDRIGSIKLVEVAEPETIGPHEVKIRVVFTGVCGSELHAYHGTHPFRKPPLISGHEFSGIVQEIGSEVTRVKVGDRVTAEPQVPCGACYECANGMYHMCPDKQVLGAHGWTGSFAEHIVMPEQVLIVLPDEVSLEHGTLYEPLAVGMHAVRISGCGAGDRVLVIGCGPIGLAIIMAARMIGCKEVIASDAVNHNLGVAMKLGATRTINVRECSQLDEIKAITAGIGVDYTFLAFGNGPIVTESIELTRKGGTIMEVAVLGSPKEVDFSNFYQREINMRGSNVYVAEDFALVGKLVESKMFDLDLYISHILPIEEAAKAFHMMDKKTEHFVKVLLRFS